MTTKVTPMSSLSLQAYLTQSRIKTDLLDAFEQLGVEETNDMIDIELSDIETIITSKNLKKVEATRLRKCYQAIKKTDTSTANETKGETKGERKEGGEKGADAATRTCMVQTHVGRQQEEGV